MSDKPTYEELEQRVKELEDEAFDRKQAEKQSNLDHSRLMSILESIPDGVYIVDKYFNIEYINPAIEKDFGKIQGRKCYQYFHDRTEVCPWCKNEEVFAGRSVSWEWYSVKNDRHYELFDTPFENPDGSISKFEIFRDITVRKRAEEALRKNEEKYRSLAENQHDIVWTANANLEIDYISPSCFKMTGLTAEETMGVNPEDLYPEESWQRMMMKLDEEKQKAPKKMQPATVEVDRYHKDGHLFPVELTFIPLFADNQFTGIQGITRDITERKNAEMTLRESEAALRERLLFEGLLVELSAKFINMPSELINNEIEQGLQLFADCLEIDQILCFEIMEDKTHSFVTHSYAVPESGPVPTIIANKNFPWVLAKMLRQEIVKIERLEDFPQEAHIDQETYRKLGVKSVLLIPFSVGGRLTCAFSFSTARKERTWPEELIRRLKVAGEIIANTLARKRADEAQMESLTQIKRLKTELESESAYLQSEIKLNHNFEKIIGQSDALKYVLFRLSQVAPTDATTLILGETGTGKELIARAIHNASPRKERPLIKVNCGALPSNLIESELFGHEKGAFTGAQARRAGRFEVANGTTLFLDEIGELPLDLQSKLLRVLQDGEFERLGSSHTIKVDVRIIASTNRNLKEEVRIGRFREDLWYRLNVFSITMPPLRERKEDIPLLANWFIDIYAKKYGKSINTIPVNVMKDLQKYPWPGNVRELEHVVERAIITTQGSRLRLMEKLDAPEREEPQNIRKSLMEVERDYIVQVLKRTGWKVDGGNGAAQILGLNPSTLRTRMKKLQIKRPGLPR